MIKNMQISIVGTGYVGLVTGVCLSEIGHKVTCIDVDEEKIRKLMQGISPIYEPGLEELIIKNVKENRLYFTTDKKEGYSGAEVIVIAVGTPQNSDGSANLKFIEQVAIDVAKYATNDIILVTKSTVPVGTNDFIKQIVTEHLKTSITVESVSNPEFLREGSAINDTFYGDRIVVGADNKEAATKIEKMYEPLNIPTFITDIRSAEMIKYASNAFLATKISFINEIANICEKVNANIEEVAIGMGHDKRIGNQFLNAGIGYGGSCFPKDTHALLQIAGEINHDFELLKSVISVNNNQHRLLVKKANERFGHLEGKNIALLGLSFKPNTDDMREAPSITISSMLVDQGAKVYGYDPIAVNNAQKVLPKQVRYVDKLETALENADMAFILTEWEEIKKIDLSMFETLMKHPIVFDGRNCFSSEQIERYNIEYFSIGRPDIKSKKYVKL
jgi:UDPglucose 6-dehydrogenase